MVFTSSNFRTLILVSLLATSTFSVAATASEAVDLYNKACHASLSGQTSEALTFFQQAVQAGFDDLRFARTDPDLAGLTSSPEFKSLLISHQSRLTLLSSERGFELQNGIWTPWADLQPSSTLDQKPAAVRLKWDTLGLEYEVRLSGALAASFTDITLPPAGGGPNVMINLAIPHETSAFESSNSFHFLVGQSKTSGVGSIFFGSNMGWQPVSELAPKIIHRNNGQVIISGFIAWQIILPYHPLADPTLGLNVAVQSNASGDHAQTLFPDPRAFTPGAEFHRFVPMVFDTETTSHESMMGKVSQSVMVNDPLQCGLTVVSSEAGIARLKLDFLDPQGNSVISEGVPATTQELVIGLNTFSHSADFRALNMGPYLVKAELEMPSGTVLSWSSVVLNMGPGWNAALQERIGKLAPGDQPTGQFYLATVSEAIDQLAVRRHPGSITTTLLELTTFLAAGTAQGNILPNSGVFLLVWNDNCGDERFCSLYLPLGHKKAPAIEPVVLWSDTPGSERRLASRVGRFCEYPRKSSPKNSVGDSKTPIYLVPHSPAQPYADLEEEVADLTDFLNWVNVYFETEKVALAGMSAAAGAVLEYSLQKPENLSRILVYSGSNLVPWPQANASFLREKFPSGATGHPPITWIDFFTETQSAGQGKLLLSVLDEAGYIVQPVERVKGGLSLTQVTDRLVLWAE